jgi:hypothetical protein
MGSYEIIVKTEEIKRKVREEDYVSALRILDTIDSRKLKKPSVLSLMAEVYTQNGRYEEAFQLLLRLYNKTKTRKILHQLIWLSIQLNNTEDAEYYLKEYEKQAPRDYNIHIFRYQIDKLKGEPFEVLIETLVKLKETEYIEQWAYELAKLYYKAGMEEECIRECSDIILWFGEGSYVEKAKVLKAYYSGEADKDMIIEELKKRARQDYSMPEEEPDRVYEEEAAAVETKEEEETEEEIEEEIEEETEDKIDFRVEYPEEEKDDDFTERMRRGVEEILSEESARKEAISGSTDGEYQIDYPYTGETEHEATQDTDYWEQEEPEPAMSEREMAEQEVEEELYRLLEEEDDEDSIRLNELQEETGLDLYEIFGNFLHVKAVRKQLVKSLDLILDKQTKSVQMIITGSPGSGKTAMAKSIALFLHMTGKLRTSKIAKTSAGKLNETDLLAKKDSLKDCCLVIENASELKRPTIDKLLELIRLYNGQIGVIFEENKKNMNKLFRECPKLMDMFKNRIHLPQYTSDELLGFAYSYLKRMDYRLQKGAQLTLKKAVEQISKKYAPEQQLETIRKLVEGAMNSADMRMGRQLTILAAQGRIGELGNMTLLPEDFKNQN